MGIRSRRVFAGEGKTAEVFMRELLALTGDPQDVAWVAGAVAPCADVTDAVADAYLAGTAMPVTEPDLGATGDGAPTDPDGAGESSTGDGATAGQPADGGGDAGGADTQPDPGAAPTPTKRTAAKKTTAAAAAAPADPVVM